MKGIKENILDIYSEPFQQLLLEIQQDFNERLEKEERLHPYKAVELLKQYRIGALRLPKELGGVEASLKDVFTAIIRIAAVDPDVAHILRAHFLFTEDLLIDPESNKKILEEIAQGKLLGNTITERSKHDAGSFKYDTTLVKVDDHYELNGTKYFSTGTLYADYTVVLATFEDGLATVIIPVNREGITLVDDWDGIGQKYTGSGTTVFDHVIVYEEEIIGGEEGHVRYAALPQIFLQAVVAGILKNVVTDAVALVEKRNRGFSHGNSANLKQDVQIQHVIGQLASDAFAAEKIVLGVAESLDIAALHNNDLEYSHLAAQLEAAQAKVAIEQFALKAASLLFEVGGASATKNSANLDRHWRNIRTLSSHNPTIYKAREIGNYYLNNSQLPANTYF